MTEQHDIINCPACGLRVVRELHAGMAEDPHTIREHGPDDSECSDTVRAMVTNGDLEQVADARLRAEREFGDEKIMELIELRATLRAAYRERARLVAYLAACYPSDRAYSDPDAPEWAVVTVETPAGQMSWHIAPDDMDLFGHVGPPSTGARDWDGHTTEEKYRRLAELTRREAARA